MGIAGQNDHSRTKTTFKIILNAFKYQPFVRHFYSQNLNSTVICGRQRNTFRFGNLETAKVNVACKSARAQVDVRSPTMN